MLSSRVPDEGSATTTTATLLLRAAIGLYGLSFLLAVVAFARGALGLSRVASGVLFAGLVLQVSAFGYELGQGGGPLLTTPFTIAGAFVLAGVCVSYGVALRHRMRLALSALFAVPVLIGFAWLAVDPAFQPFGDRLDSTLVQVHLGLLVLAYGFFSVAGSLGVMLVLRARSLKEKSPGLLEDSLPPLMTLDAAVMETLGAGFLTLTASVVAACAYSATGGWSGGGKAYKAGIALVVWTIYASVLWARRRSSWSSPRLGRVAVGACAVAFVAFIAIEWVGARG